MFVASFGSTLSQDVELQCDYVLFFGEYICFLNGIEVLDPSANVIFTGQHIGDRTNDDVEIVQIDNSNTPFVIPQIFTTFPFLIDLTVQESNLQSINIPDSIQLVWLYLYGNNISTIESSDVTGLVSQRSLNYLYITSSLVQNIDENAFVGLENVTALVLINNNITEIRNGTLAPLVNVRRIDFERNSLSRIEEDTFAWNRNVQSIYLEFNQINAVSPRFLVSQRDSFLNYVNLRGNECVDELYFVNEETGLIRMNNELRGCFNNFLGEVSELRRVIMEFVGHITIIDEFGNIIARF